MKKRYATLLSLSIITAMYFVTLFTAPEVLNAVGGAMVMAVALAGGLHIAGEVGSNYNRSKYYKPELDENHPGYGGKAN